MNETGVTKCFLDIINGYTKTTVDNRTTYIKHFNSFDQFEIDEIYKEKYEHARKINLPTEEEELTNLRQNNVWTKEDQKQEEEFRYNLEGAILTRKNLFIPSHIKDCENNIKQFTAELNEKLAYKENLMGLTAEKYAARRSNSEYVRCSLYTDSSLTQLCFDKTTFDEMDQGELNGIVISFNNAMSHIDTANIKKAALSPAFQNLYQFNNNPYYFFGCPITRLTLFQASLFSYGSYYSHILKDLGKIDEGIKNDPEALESLFISTQNKEKERARFKGKGKTEFMGSNDNPGEMDYIEAAMLQRGFNSLQAAQSNI